MYLRGGRLIWIHSTRCGATDPDALSRLEKLDQTHHDGPSHENVPIEDRLVDPLTNLRFGWPWRPYQAHLLDAVESHLGDDRLHVVAAPGAGKTTLGLEVFRRLGRPALVLTPTLTIRDQWILRLGDFVVEEDATDSQPGVAAWTSTDIRAPSFLTVTTYQALLARHRADPAAGDAEEEVDGHDDFEGLGLPPVPAGDDLRSFTDLFREAGIRTLILDEAHHLKQEWWKALARVVDEVPDLTLVSLTATPPYDATGREWVRYEELCGPIDDEISVPELVKAGTLCPHQDFVMVVSPGADEVRDLYQHDRAVLEFLLERMEDEEFHDQVARHPWVAAQAPEPEAVLERPELAVALVVYLLAAGAALPQALLDLLELSQEEIPSIGLRWWQLLLDEYLFGSSFDESRKDHRDRLALCLRRDGLLWRRELRIDGSRSVTRSLALSGEKVEACLDIYREERRLRGDDLRMVVLTDYIRDEGWELAAGDRPAELGVIPVFDQLTRELRDKEVRGVGVVTGRLSLVHESLAAELMAAVGDRASVLLNPAPHRPGWLRVEGVSGSRLVEAFTCLLTDGRLQVLVGTRSLLGEGWDAPAVNSVVLASFVGSFVSTNQMRGRAIRTDPNSPDKVASVWHIAAMVPNTPTGGRDLEQLGERFRTFVGLSADGTIIESGIDRMELPEATTARELQLFNDENIRRHRNLHEVTQAWDRALLGEGPSKVVPTLRMPRALTLRPFHTRRTLRYLLYELGLSGLTALGWSLGDLVGVDSLRTLGLLLATAAGLTALRLAPKLFKAATLAFRHLPIDGSVTQMGQALLEALRSAELIADPDGSLGVRTEREADGGVTVALEGGSFYEQSLFADAMSGLLGPVENPRYIITREGPGGPGDRKDFHAVPTCLGVNKERALGLLEAWRRLVAPAELIFTRRKGGRGVLLAARTRAFSGAVDDGLKRLDRWQ